MFQKNSRFSVTTQAPIQDSPNLRCLRGLRKHLKFGVLTRSAEQSRFFYCFRKAILPVLFFGLLLWLGLSIYKDYGISFDEPTQMQMGILNYRYARTGDNSLLTWKDRYYGPFFEEVLVYLQGQGPLREVYFQRHLLTFLCFFGGCLAFFGAALYRYRKLWLALAGTLFLVLSPRIFANSFYNSKDIPFMVFYSLAVFSLLWLVDHPGWLAGIGHAAVTGAALAIRLPALLIPALTIFALLVEVLSKRLSWRKALGLGALYLLVSAAVMTALWPGIWPNPVQGFLAALGQMSRFPYDLAMLFQGQVVQAMDLPWQYIPVWLGITTPVLYLALFLLGAGLVLAAVLRKPAWIFSQTGRDDLIVLGAAGLPVLAVILLKSTLYDGWRQMFFIYPAFVLIALKGLEAAVGWLRRSHLRPAAPYLTAAILAAALAPVAWGMLSEHPYQNVYFNRLAGPDLQTVQKNYMLDYWGLSYRASLEYIVSHDDSAQIPVLVETIAGSRNADILDPVDAHRLEFVSDIQEAKYFIGNYYMNMGYPFKDEVFSVQVGDAKISSVYLLDEEDKH